MIQWLTRPRGQRRWAKSRPAALDWWPNEFFNDDRRFLTCGTHGSLYEPDTGKCAGGPCAGGALFPLHAQVVGDRIVVTANCDA